MKKKKRERKDKIERKKQESPSAARESAVTNSKAAKDIHLLQQGYQPDKNKIGSEFRGKNKVIIA